MELAAARLLAQEVVERLRPYCSRIEVAGSIRRQKPQCHDVDIVVTPGNQGKLAMALRGLGTPVKSGPLMHTCRYRGQQVDIYIANETTWWTILLIRTGSKEHNITLCTRAKFRGMKLHANGSGIELKDGTRLVPTSEEQVFQWLDLPYQPPEKRG